MKEKVILAYSGGLDTTAIIPWLKENFNYDVVCVCIDCGQEEELDGLEERAKSCGAEKLYILDVIDEFCDEYIVPCVQAHAVYENKYLLGTSMARPLIAKKLVEIAMGHCKTRMRHARAEGSLPSPWLRPCEASCPQLLPCPSSQGYGPCAVEGAICPACQSAASNVKSGIDRKSIAASHCYLCACRKSSFCC